MLNETRIESIAILALTDAVNALSETQTILQLMVKKGLVTPEEVAVTRGVVKSQPKYKQLFNMLDDAMKKTKETAKFEELFEKSLQSGGNKNLTEEEREYLLKELDDITKYYAKKAKDSGIL